MSLFITIIFLSHLATSGFGHCQRLINEQDGLFMSSRKAVLMSLFHW